MTEKFNSKVKAHTRYRLKDGKTIVPGVSTITNLLDKPALVRWANKLGLQGIDSTKYTSEKAEIGTLAHSMLLCHLKKIKTDTSEYSQVIIDKAENCFLSYLNWEKKHKVEPILIEEPLVSETHRLGGTPDFYGKVDGELTLMDFKTGNGIYPEHWYQVAGYSIILNKDYPKSFVILNIPRVEDEEFIESKKSNLTIQTRIFLHLLEIYALRKEEKK